MNSEQIKKEIEEYKEYCFVKISAYEVIDGKEAKLIDILEHMAERIEDLENVNKNKGNVKKASKTFKCDLRNKCGGCEHFDYTVHTSVGSPCVCENKVFNNRIAAYRAKTTKACKYYKERNDMELTYTYRKGVKQ